MEIYQLYLFLPLNPLNQDINVLKKLMRQKKAKTFLAGLVICFLWVKNANSQLLLLPPEYLGFVQEKIISYFVYPEEARIKGWEGVVKVRFTLVQDGRIKEIDVAQSSGYPLLDAAAILAVKDASPYPFPKDYTQKDELEIILPINYKQTQSSLSIISKDLPATTPIQPEKSLTSAPVLLPKETLPVLPGPAPLILSGPAPTPQELTYFVDLALKNNQPTKVAQEEIEFAQIKVAEAQRNLYPGLKIQSYRTLGESFNIDTEEREIKTEVTQPVYYGWRLVDTLNQAKVNLEITQKNYDRLKLDVIQKTETAYYNLVAANMHLRQKEALYREAKEMLEKIERLAEMGMIIPLEVNSARTWFNQIKFQMDSIKQDLFMAELTFQQVLNAKETPQIEAKLLEAKRLDLDLGPCVEAAIKHRPEVYLSELLVKFNDYGQKIEASKNKELNVDFTTSYGFYQGAFETEPLRDSHNWYVGLKASIPWGANTLNTSYTQGRSDPTLGQTTPTASSTVSVEFNLLDNLKRLSDKKRSDIDLHRALSDFNETTKTITFEVQDAFLNYQKAVLQLNTAESEMKFRRSEAEVIKVRAMVGETSLSNAMESLYSFSDAQSKYLQALANYHISLANLKKATGYGIRI